MSNAPFSPRVIRKAKQCDSIDCTEMCNERWMAANDGVFYFDEKREGYIHVHLTGPYGIPLLLDACPFCKSILPGKAQRRAWDEQCAKKAKEKLNPPQQQADGVDGGEGWE